jgi:hypothetical protein
VIEPIPPGWVPVATVFPAHPLVGLRGVGIPFAHDRHDRFQRLLRAHGDPLHLSVKDDVVTSVREDRLARGHPRDKPATRSLVSGSGPSVVTGAASGPP